MSQQYPEWQHQDQPAQPQYGQPQYGNLPAPQPGYPQPYGIGYPQQVAPKNPGLALLASFFIPGLGTLINGNIGLGIAIFAAYCVAAVLCFIIIGFVLLPAVWVWGMIDAYQGAKKWNTTHGIVS